MTREVAFHFNAPDKVGYACRLLRKAYRSGARLWVRVPADLLSALDTALWTQTPGDFIPHSRPGDAEEVRARSPIHLDTDVQADASRGVLVNLAHDVPPHADAYERVIEVVTLGEADREAARQRWRHYKGIGIEPLRHDLNLAS
jgi:DNA polymerase-3 subunit chi